MGLVWELLTPGYGLLSVAYDLVKITLLASQAEAEELNQLQSVGTSIVIGLSFRFASDSDNLVFTASRYLHTNPCISNVS